MTLQEIATVTDTIIQIEFDPKEESFWLVRFVDLYFDDKDDNIDSDKIKCSAVGSTLKESLAVLAHKMKGKKVVKRWETKKITLPKIITYIDPEI